MSSVEIEFSLKIILALERPPIMDVQKKKNRKKRTINHYVFLHYFVSQFLAVF